MKHPHYDIAMWHFSDPENNRVQIFRGIGQQWVDLASPAFDMYSQYRRKPAPPKRITINWVEINAPLSEAPANGTPCYAPGVGCVNSYSWEGFSWQTQALANGRIFATEQDAQAAYDAITLALTGGKQ